MSDMEDLDKQLDGDTLNKDKSSPPKNVLVCARYGADLFSDVVQALLAFIPNGLNVTYNATLKRIPFVGPFFCHQWVEEVLKMVTGITIGKGLSRDLGRYVFWPMGFVLGIFISLFTRDETLKYKGSFGKVVNQLSGQTMLGALAGVLSLVIGVYTQRALSLEQLPWQVWLVAILGGGLVGMTAKTIMLLALEAVTRANAASSRLNAKRAQKLGTLLKKQLKEKTYQKVYQYARSIIEQNNGPQLESTLTSFFAHNHDNVCETTFKKIDRHITYLTDRAIHGDVAALKKLFSFYRDQNQGNGTVDAMLERIVNAREVILLKDNVDNLYDRWVYRANIRVAA